MQIASNTTALMAAAALNSANTQVAKASERISTGLRINRAADDPAGLGMANRLKAQVASYSQVVQNISQGAAAVTLVDDALSSMSDLLSSMRVAAVASQSDSISASDRTAYQSEIDGYVTAMSSVASNSTWNGTSLMTAASTMNIQVGTASGDSTSVVFSKMTTSELGVSALSVSSTGHATTAVTAIDAAIDDVSEYQAYIGAKASVLQVQSDMATSTITNFSGAYGNIMNADLAAETANLASAQIRQDGATAMLAQATSMNKELVAYLLKAAA